MFKCIHFLKKISFIYLIPFNLRAPLIFAQLKRAKNEGARKWPIFAHDGARKLKRANWKKK